MAQGNPQTVVPVILSTVRGELILQRRDNNSLGAEYLRDKWGFFGGHCEDGETPPETAIRELFEELELRLDPRALEAAGVYQKQPAVHGDNNFVHVFCYAKPVVPTKFVVHEGRGYALVNKDDVSDAPLTVLTRQHIRSYFGFDKEIEKYRIA